MYLINKWSVETGVTNFLVFFQTRWMGTDCGYNAFVFSVLLVFPKVECSTPLWFLLGFVFWLSHTIACLQDFEIF